MRSEEKVELSLSRSPLGVVMRRRMRITEGGRLNGIRGGEERKGEKRRKRREEEDEEDACTCARK